MAPKVLISDKLSPAAVQIFKDRGIDVDFQPDLGKDKDKLAEIIGNYDGLAIRSATKVTEKILAAADNLKVIGRAGIGTDNIDKDAASKKGVIVMNTPFGNMITTAEHAIAMMFAVARQIPEASASTHQGKWEKSKFMGVELTGKTLGVIGAGNIGGIVCDRARALKILAAADNLKVIGRAGIGTDNIDKDAASKKGVIVMNTPFGNMITTAEHAIAMMFAVARQIPEASASTHQGKWEKSKFMGVELTGKTLGVIGAGNIGGIVCDRARALKMKVLAYDPFLGDEKAEKMGVEKVELEDLLPRADFITLHVPFTEQTANILSRENLGKTKPGVRIVNCARGGLVDEEALADMLKSGHVAGAAFDVFKTEPATENPLFNLPNVVCTPHLGAATTEAQENVALQVAEQMSDYLLTGAVTNALNMPSVTAEEAKVMGPWLKLSGHLGSFIGQLTDEPIKAINILYDGTVSEMNLDALNCGVVAGIMKRANPDVNMVSAPVAAREKGIQISTTNQDKSGVFDGYIKVTVVTDKRERSIAGTVFSDGKPRFIQIKGINIDAEVGAHMVYTTNEDVPGIIGTLGQTMGENGVNIANFTLGRASVEGEAIALLYVDAPVPAPVIAKLQDTGMFTQVKTMHFDVA